ncbi:hypothetical protein ACQ4LE_006224 [Meloidogyne hapla]
MDIRAKLIEIQKSRKRRLPINDSSKLSEVHQPGTNLEEDTDENSEANLIKFEQGVTNKGNVVALWHAGYRYVKNDKNSNYWRCSNKDCPAKAKQEGGQFIGILGKKEHNHPPVIQKKTAEEIRNKLKREARGNILAEVRANIPDEVYISLGTDCALQHLMYRQKNRQYGNVNCTDMSRMVIPEHILMDCDILNASQKNVTLKMGWIMKIRRVINRVLLVHCLFKIKFSLFSMIL